MNVCAKRCDDITRDGNNECVVFVFVALWSFHGVSIIIIIMSFCFGMNLSSSLLLLVHVAVGCTGINDDEDDRNDDEDDDDDGFDSNDETDGAFTGLKVDGRGCTS
jgi:hypothetical protein